MRRGTTNGASEMTAAEAGRKGGTTTSERHGLAHYKRVGSLGGQTTAERYGHDFYVSIGKRGGARVRELIAAGKASEGPARGEDAARSVPQVQHERAR